MICKRGHDSPRSKDGHCVECVRLKGAKVRLTASNVEYMKQWRKANKDRCREYESAWRARNPENDRIRKNHRRGLERDAAGFHTEEDLLFLRETQTECKGCGLAFSVEIPATVDHIVALKNGGSNWPSNLQLLCRPCTSAKGTKDNDEWSALTRVKQSF